MYQIIDDDKNLQEMVKTGLTWIYFILPTLFSGEYNVAEIYNTLFMLYIFTR